jgi:hypothetical protein
VFVGVLIGAGVLVGAGVGVEIEVEVTVEVGVFVFVGLGVSDGFGVVVGRATSIVRTIALTVWVASNSGEKFPIKPIAMQPTQAHSTTPAILPTTYNSLRFWMDFDIVTSENGWWSPLYL